MKKNLIWLILLTIILSCNRSAQTIPENSNLKLEFYETGKIKAITIFNDAISEKESILFNKNGNIISTQKKKNTLKEGQNIFFYPNGNVENIVMFKNGMANGNIFWFYDDGAIKSHGYCKNDKLFGYAINYIHDSIGTLKNFVFYDDSGKISWQKNAAPGSLGIRINRNQQDSTKK